MAFTLPLTINGEAQAAAYVKATIARCDTQTTVVQLQTWLAKQAVLTVDSLYLTTGYLMALAHYRCLLQT